jgi:hypothetical protein
MLNDFVYFYNQAHNATGVAVRDPSAWYHFILSVNSGTLTAYINGSQISTGLTGFSYGGYSTIGQWVEGGYNFDGYFADIYLIDGQALAPTDFGETDDNGVWQPKKFDGTYGPLVDQSQTWSSGTTTGTWDSSYPLTQLFNGSLSDGTQAANSGPATLAFSSVTAQTSIEVYGFNTTTGTSEWQVTANGTDYVVALPGNPGGWVTVPATYPATLDQISNLVYRGRLSGVRVDGKLLVDSGVSVTDNSYHLDFADNSSQAALGTDTSGNGNTWDVNNITPASATIPAFTAYSASNWGDEAYLWDGSLSTYSYPNANTTSTLTFTPALTGSSIRIYVGSSLATTGFNINGSSLSGFSGGTTSQWRDITSHTGGTLSYIQCAYVPGQYSQYIYAIEIDGDILQSTAQTVVGDSLVDSPTNGTQPDTGAGGEVVGNYATLNPLQNINNDTFSDGNLKVQTNSGNYGVHTSTIATPLTGKWYAEVLIASTSGYDCISIVPSDSTLTTSSFGQNIPNAVTYGGWNGSLTKNTASFATGATFTTNDIIGIAYDADNSTVVFYKNNVAQPTVTGVAVKEFFFAGSDYDAGAVGQYVWNFGQRAFMYAAPSGYKALCTANLPTPTIADGSKYFDTKLYTGNDTQRNISGLSFSPDLVWIKTRNTTSNHSLMDTVRGATKNLVPNDTQAEGTEPSYLNAFNSDGFSLGTSSVVNGNNNTYAAWAWDAGTSGANEVGSYWSPIYNTKYIGFKFPTSGGGRAVFGLESGTGTADIYTSTDNSSWTRVQQNVTLSTTDSSYNSSAQYLIVVNTSDATWGAHHYAMATNGTDGHYSSGTYPGSGASFTWSGPGYTDWDFRSSGTVIKPGGLNSLLYNQSQTWSNLVTGTLDTQYGNPSTAAPFQGTTGTNYTDGIRPTGGNYLSMNFGSTFASATTVTIYGHVSLDGVTYNGANENLKINGTALTAAGWANNGGGTGSGQASATFTLSSGLTSLEWGYSAGSQSTGYLYLQAIAVDGKLLVDSTVTPPSVPSMASTIRANPSAGFSICTYTGTEGGTFGHGLNAAPKFVMVKRRSNPAAAWCVWHTAIPNTQYLMLNDTAGVNTANVWGNTSPTSSVVSVSGDSYTGNNGDTYVAYCFAPVEGYSSFGKFTANASADGPFVYLGFRPALVVCKKSSSSSIWITLDSERDPNNVTTKFLRWNDITAEASTADRIDFLSNGFKLRAPGGYSPNETNGDTYIYLAFAEHPFKTARAR